MVLQTLQTFHEIDRNSLVVPIKGNGIARWLYVALAVLLDAALLVRSSSEEDFSGRGDFSSRVNMSSDSFPPKLFRMRV